MLDGRECRSPPLPDKFKLLGETVSYGNVSGLPSMRLADRVKRHWRNNLSTNKILSKFGKEKLKLSFFFATKSELTTDIRTLT